MWHRFPIEWKYERSALFAVVAFDKYLFFSFVQSNRSDGDDDSDASIPIVCVNSLSLIRADVMSAYWMSITSTSPEWKRHSETKTVNVYRQRPCTLFNTIVLITRTRERETDDARKTSILWILIHFDFMLCIVRYFFLRTKSFDEQTKWNCIDYWILFHSKNCALEHISIKIHDTFDVIAFEFVAMQLNCALSFAPLLLMLLMLLLLLLQSRRISQFLLLFPFSFLFSTNSLPSKWHLQPLKSICTHSLISQTKAANTFAKTSSNNIGITHTHTYTFV